MHLQLRPIDGTDMKEPGGLTSSVWYTSTIQIYRLPQTPTQEREKMIKWNNKKKKVEKQLDADAASPLESQLPPMHPRSIGSVHGGICRSADID